MVWTTHVWLACIAAAVVADRDASRGLRGLALACFAKVDGVVFLGTPRTPAAAAAAERGLTALGPMAALAAACVAIGVLPALVVPPALAVGASIGLPTAPPDALAAVGAALPRVTLVAVAVALIAAALWLARGRRLAGAPVATSGTWACAGAPPTPRMQYTASSYAAPLLAAFGPLAGVRAHAGAAGFHSHPLDLVLDGLVFPAWRRLGRLAQEARLLQAGRLRWYLLYVILTVLALLVYVGRARGSP